MRFMSFRDIRISSAELTKQLSNGEKIIITSHGQPLALMVSVSEYDFEDVMKEIIGMQSRLDQVRRQTDSGEPYKGEPYADEPYMEE